MVGALVAVLENYQQEDGSIIVPDALRPYMNGHVYQNYPNRALKDFAKAYWGDATYLRLREVKTKYDPSNFFCYEQSIAPL